jgi:alpha-tubulin suppressor-like RCC1 family protein
LTTPVELPLTNVTLAAGAGDHATYYDGGKLYSCGDNVYGELGTGNMKNSPTPKLVDVDVAGFPGPPVTVTAIAAGWAIEGVTLSDGSIWDWGYNAEGQLGNGSNQTSDFPVKALLALPLGTSVKAVSEGGSGTNFPGQTLALLSDGSVWAWGDNSDGQFCSATPTMYEQPTPITPLASVTQAGVAQVWTGGAASYFIDTTGQLWDCGDNSNGDLGIGTTGGDETTPQEPPTLIGIGLGQVTATSHTVSALSSG